MIVIDEFLTSRLQLPAAPLAALETRLPLPFPFSLFVFFGGRYRKDPLR